MIQRTISILGSTGSIGTQTLDVAETCGIRVAALTANHNIDLLEQQARIFKPVLVAAADMTAAAALAQRLSDTEIRVMGGQEGILGGVISEFGDLAFSYIKRTRKIKDFGTLLPGHGGVLDRFDSVIFCAPLVEILIDWIPVFK